MLNIVNSNRTEALLAVLLRNLRNSGNPDPFAAWQILVPSIGMRTLLQNRVAQHMGVCANVEFSFLAQWLWKQAARLTQVQERSPLTVDAMTWRIYAALEDQAFVAVHPRLSFWLAHADPAMRYDLCQRVAALFDKYMTYRPEWMAAWMDGKPAVLGMATGATQQSSPPGQANEDQSWQMALWQRIAGEMRLPGHHPFDEFRRLLKSSGPAQLAASGIPPEIHVFALPAIPPIYLDMLIELSAHIDIHLYLVNPCQQYWFDIVDPKRLRYLAAKGQDAHLETGNRLLAIWGKQSRGFLELLLGRATPASDEDCFVPPLHGDSQGPSSDSLLARLQSAVLDLHELEPGSAADVAADGSIEFHSCHTLARELEVLQDRLLGHFNSSQPPSPSQVLVVLPDLEQAAPLIDAVFGSATAVRHIPYRITGRPASSANPVAVALLALVAIAGSRYYASQVFALLQNPLIGARFGIGPSDLDVILGWLPATQTHWGLDGEQRASFNAPASDRHTFRDGMARLYLGYALPGAVQQPFAGLLAPCNVEGDDSRIVACVDNFLRALSALEARLADAASPATWRATLLGIADEFLHVSGAELADLASTRNAITTLAANMETGGATRLPLAVVRAALKEALDEPTRGGSPTGSVTFSALSSLRNLPYDMVCLLGMCDGAFPGLNRPGEFDLMQGNARLGDRDKREEERNLFLDLVLAARRSVYISYTGRSVRDNSPLPPSVLVSDLLDYLADATAMQPDDRASRAAARAALVLEHPLQPFSETYFDRRGDPRLFSFHAEYCDALNERRLAVTQAALEPAGVTSDLIAPLPAGAGNVAEEANEANEADDADAANGAIDVNEGGDAAEEDSVAEPLPAFFEHKLPPAPAEWRRVTPEQLIEFYRNPSRYLLRRRMRLQLPDEAVQIDDDESFLPGYLAAIQLAQRLLPHMLDGASRDQLHALACAGLEYPSGPIGNVLLDAELDAMAAFAQTLQPKLAAPVLAPVSGTLAFDIGGEQWQLEGALADLRPDGLVRYRYADATVADYLSAWIPHLFLNTCAGQPQHTEWLARNGRFGFLPVDDAGAILRELIVEYRRGLSEPLHFFPKSAWAWIRDDKRSAATSKWKRGQFPGEGDDPAYQLALRGHPDPLDREFDALAVKILGTMKQHLDGEAL